MIMKRGSKLGVFGSLVFRLTKNHKTDVSNAILLGMGDIAGRYRRSYLGAWWITVNMLALGFTFYVALGSRFSNGGTEYLEYLLAGLTAWTFLGVSTTELCRCLYESRELHLAMKFPYWATSLRVVTRNLIIYGHNLAAASVVILITSGSEFSTLIISTMRLLLGLALCSGTLLSCGVFLSIICSKFRDFEQIIGAIMQILFYLTPILWRKGEGGQNLLSKINNINPFYHGLELLRQPLLGGAAGGENVIACLSIFIVMGLASVLILKRSSKKVIFWI